MNHVRFFCIAQEMRSIVLDVLVSTAVLPEPSEIHKWLSKTYRSSFSAVTEFKARKEKPHQYRGKPLSPILTEL